MSTTSQNSAMVPSIGIFFSLMIIGPSHPDAATHVFAIVACLVAAVASWLRGSKYVHPEPDPATEEPQEAIGR